MTTPVKSSQPCPIPFDERVSEVLKRYVAWCAEHPVEEHPCNQCTIAILHPSTEIHDEVVTDA